MKWSVDEMISWWNDQLMKWQVDEMISWWNGKLMKWPLDEKTYHPNFVSGEKNIPLRLGDFKNQESRKLSLTFHSDSIGH